MFYVDITSFYRCSYLIAFVFWKYLALWVDILARVESSGR